MEPRVLRLDAVLVALLDAALWVAIAGSLWAACGLLVCGDWGHVASGAATFGLAGTASALSVGLLALEPEG